MPKAYCFRHLPSCVENNVEERRKVNYKFASIYLNGKIFTADRNDSFKEAMAIRHGEITWIGTNKEAKLLIEKQTQKMEVIDLAGACVIPGFVDSAYDYARELYAYDSSSPS